jgi:hypothetical protein
MWELPQRKAKQRSMVRTLLVKEETMRSHLQMMPPRAKTLAKAALLSGLLVTLGQSPLLAAEMP